MTKKRAMVLALILVACTGLAVALVVYSARSGITKAKYDRIEKGMAKVEVEATLGRPSERQQVTADGLRCEWWSRSGVSIVVAFDDHDQVAVTRWIEDEQTFLQRVRTWLGL